MKLSLVVLAAGKQEGNTLDIKVPNFLIGRDPQCHLRPSSPMISKKHAALIVKDGKVYLKDFGSTNGSFVNDVPVKNAVQLKHGDKLKIGPLHFEVRLETDSAVSQPAAAAASQPAGKAAAPAAAKAGQAAKPAQPAAAAKPGQAQPAASAKPAAASAAHPPDEAKSKRDDADDDIAAMLLSGMGDDTVSDTPAAQDDIPQGTTVFDLPVPNEPGKEGQPAKKEDKPAKPTPSTPDTHSAAAAILEQMRKRPRS